MAEFTAKDVMKLREQTGAGMMDCKKALTDADGDFEKAGELLRERGIAKAAKRASKVAAEGVVYALVDGKKGVLEEINCESDFVVNGEKFRALAEVIARQILASGAKDVSELLASDMGGGKTVETYISEQTGVIGEKIAVRRFVVCETEGFLETYIHMGGTLGVMLDFACAETAEVKELAHNLALHTAFTKPAYLAAEDVSEETIAKERAILMQEVRNDEKMANKPEKVIEGIVQGKLKKFYEENCLLEQKFIKDDKVTVKQLIASVSKETGVPITLKSFVFFVRGEGIEKKSEDLAEEVAKQVRAAKK